MISLNVNGKTYKLDVPLDMPLLWAIRDNLKLTGTKYGCGVGECGSCTVHIDGEAQRSCSVSVEDAQGKKITTIEGLPENHSRTLIYFQSRKSHRFHGRCHLSLRQPPAYQKGHKNCRKNDEKGGLR